MRINGAVADEIEACLLVATLDQAGDRDSLAAADRIANGLLGQEDVDLSGDEAVAVLACLEEPPGGLDELRSVLMSRLTFPNRRRLGVFATLAGLLADAATTKASAFWELVLSGTF
jgi:hypothetical protein